MTKALDDTTIAAALIKRPEWRRDGDAITRTVKLKGFARPLLLANAIGHLAEEADHHPDLTVSYGSLTIRLSTHDAGGLSERDFALAGRIDDLAD